MYYFFYIPSFHAPFVWLITLEELEVTRWVPLGRLFSFCLPIHLTCYLIDDLFICIFFFLLPTVLQTYVYIYIYRTTLQCPQCQFLRSECHFSSSLYKVCKYHFQLFYISFYMSLFKYSVSFKSVLLKAPYPIKTLFKILLLKS